MQKRTLKSKIMILIVIVIFNLLLCNGGISADNNIYNKDKKIVDLSKKGGHCLAIMEDGSLWAWGGNESGQLGDGTQVDKKYTCKDWER